MLTTLMPGHELNGSDHLEGSAMSIRGGAEDAYLYLVCLTTATNSYAVEYWVGGNKPGGAWVTACETPNYDEAVSVFWSVYQLKLWSSA